MDPLTFIQKSFSGGINRQVDATRLADNEYSLMINGRNRFDVISPIRSPVLANDLPLGNYQGVYGAENFTIAFISGKAYYRNVSTSLVWNLISGFQLSADVEFIFAELVPASTINFKRVPTSDIRNASINLTSIVSGSPTALIVSDGVSQPQLIFADGTTRMTKKYSEWSNSDLSQREYVPIMRQMLYQDGILYGISPDGKFIYHSVTGRPVDYMINIDKDGNKLPLESDGGALSVAHAVDFNEITALSRLNTPDGSFFISTKKSSYIVKPDFNNLIFGEPTFNTQYLFSTGCLNNFSMIDILGDSALIDFAGIRSFNAILNTFNEGRNA